MIGPIAERGGTCHSLLIRPPFCRFIWLAWRRLLGIATGIPIQNLDSFQRAVERRLDFDVFEVLRDLVLLKRLLTD